MLHPCSSSHVHGMHGLLPLSQPHPLSTLHVARIVCDPLETSVEVIQEHVRKCSTGESELLVEIYLGISQLGTRR